MSTAGTRYRYRDTTGATCKLVLLREGVLTKAVCTGAQVDYVLGTAQGDVRVEVTTGELATELRSCASFGPSTGAVVVQDGSDGRIYKAKDAGEPAACP